MSRATYFDAMDPALSLAGAFNLQNKAQDAGEGNPNHDPSTGQFSSGGGGGGGSTEKPKIISGHMHPITGQPMHQEQNTTAGSGWGSKGAKPRTTPKIRTGEWVKKTDAGGKTYKEYVKRKEPEPYGAWKSSQRAASNLANANVAKKPATPQIAAPAGSTPMGFKPSSSRPPGSSATHKGQPAIHEILGGHGITHTPGSGYKPELDPYQHYSVKGKVPASHVEKSLRQQGFYNPISPGGKGGTMQKMYGGGHAQSLERTVAPYRTESVTLHSANGEHVDRISHYSGGHHD